MKLRGSMAHLRIIFMPNALSVNIKRSWSSFLASSAIVIAASSARLIICLSGRDFISICAVVCVFGLTMDAPSVGLPYPCVHMKSVGFHAA